MNTKTKLKNDILYDLRNLLTEEQLEMVGNSIDKNMIGFDVRTCENLPCVADDTNEYLIKLYVMKKEDKLSPKTIAFYLSTLKQFLVALDNKNLKEITTEDIEYFLYLKKGNNKNISLNNMRRNLSAFFTWMRKSHIITENPCESVEPYKEPVKPIDHLSADEMETLKSGCKNTRDHMIIEVLRSTACRIGEMLPIKVNDIDFSTGKILIYREKTNEYRPVWLDSVALMFVKKHLKEKNIDYDSGRYLLENRNGEMTKAESIRSVIKRIANNSGLKRRVYPHLFLKTTATKIITRGASMSDVGEYLGHRDKSVAAKHYAYINEEHTKRIFDQYVAII